MKTFHCAICGQFKIMTRIDQKYCSERCRKRAKREREKETHWARCAYCGEAFIPRRTDQKCCKPAHRVALCRQLKKLGGE